MSDKNLFIFDIIKLTNNINTSKYDINLKINYNNNNNINNYSNLLNAYNPLLNNILLVEINKKNLYINTQINIKYNNNNL